MSNTNKRQDWDRYFMRMAHTAASRSTCPRSSVGAIFVKDKVILSTGYNGAVSGTRHCDEYPDSIHVVNGHCDIALHAEVNAIIQAAKKGTALESSTLYCTHMPCWSCAKAILNLGVLRICYNMEYRPDYRVPEYCQELGVKLEPVLLTGHPV